MNWKKYRNPDGNIYLQQAFRDLLDKEGIGDSTGWGTEYIAGVMKLHPIKSRQVAASVLACAVIFARQGVIAARRLKDA